MNAAFGCVLGQAESVIKNDFYNFALSGHLNVSFLTRRKQNHYEKILYNYAFSILIKWTKNVKRSGVQWEACFAYE